jgi:hypothetical protein
MSARDRRLRFAAGCRWGGLMLVAIALAMPPDWVVLRHGPGDAWRQAGSLGSFFAETLRRSVFAPLDPATIQVGVALVLPAVPLLGAAALARRLRRSTRRAVATALRLLAWTAAAWIVALNARWILALGATVVLGGAGSVFLAFEALTLALLLAPPRRGRGDGTAAAGALAAALAWTGSAFLVWYLIDVTGALGPPSGNPFPLPLAHGLLPGGLALYALPSYTRRRRRAPGEEAPRLAGGTGAASAGSAP